MALFLNIGVLVYFIYQQFNYGDVHKFRYFVLPLFALYKLVTISGWHTRDIPGVFLIAVVSLFISWFQAHGTRVREEHIAKYYFKNKAGKEIPIYSHSATARGGWYYLIGWGVILGIELLLEVNVSQMTLDNVNIGHLVFSETLQSLLAVYAVANPGHNDWSVWSLTFFTSLGYTLWLMHKSAVVKEALLNPDAFEVVDE